MEPQSYSCTFTTKPSLCLLNVTLTLSGAWEKHLKTVICAEVFHSATLIFQNMLPLLSLLFGATSHFWGTGKRIPLLPTKISTSPTSRTTDGAIYPVFYDTWGRGKGSSYNL